MELQRSCSHRWSGLRRLRQLFNGFILLTVCIVLGLEMFIIKYEPLPPPPGLQEILISADVSDGRRLGNLMFCYASLLGIADHNNMTPIIPASSRLVQIFEIGTRLTPNLKHTMLFSRIHEEYGHRGSAYDFTTRHLERTHTQLYGYYQSWRYFENINPTVRTNLRFRVDYLQPALDFLQTNLPRERSPSFVRVGVHVRRGDMTQEYYQRYGYVVPDASYFKNAMEYFESKFSEVQFVVCSDDPQWSRENIHGDNVVFSEGHSDAVDLAVLSLCNHTIVSVGSFGWWGAYLANGITVYYEDWPRPNTLLEYNVDKKTYFPPDWVPMV